MQRNIGLSGKSRPFSGVFVGICIRILSQLCWLFDFVVGPVDDFLRMTKSNMQRSNFWDMALHELKLGHQWKPLVMCKQVLMIIIRKNNRKMKSKSGSVDLEGASCCWRFSCSTSSENHRKNYWNLCKFTLIIR